MGSQTKIFVIKAKEILYTAIFVLLGIVCIILFIYMFLPKSESSHSEPASNYIAGVYSTTITLDNASFDVKVAVTNEKLTSVSLDGLDEATSSMYPLLETTVENINTQLEKGISFENLQYNSESQYTNTILQQAIKNALQRGSHSNQTQ